MNDVKSAPKELAHSLTIIKQPHGGYLVGNGVVEPGMYRDALYACSEIEEALAWVKWSMTGVMPPI